jgi:hypothetical protein
MVTFVLAHVFMWLHLQENAFQISWMKYDSGDNVLAINSDFELQLKNSNAHVNLCSWKLVNVSTKTDDFKQMTSWYQNYKTLTKMNPSS